MALNSSNRRFVLRAFSHLLTTYALFQFRTVVADGRSTSNLDGLQKYSRTLHVVLNKLSISDAFKLVDAASLVGFSNLMFGVGYRGSIALRSMRWMRARRDSWSPNMLKELVDYCKSRRMMVTAEIPLLTKADVLFLGEMPEILFNKSTYDPRKERVYDCVLPFIDEVIEITGISALHIGHDEVWGWKPRDYELGRLAKDEHMLPADLFVADIERLHRHLKSRNVQTWLWGDMLVSKEEFPRISSHGSLHAGIESHGYGRLARARISREIIICDWQYRNTASEFPTLKAFVDDGFRTFGATFENLDVTRAFARYAGTHGAAGMIATTWYHVTRKNWSAANRIINGSGKIFREYFPE